MVNTLSLVLPFTIVMGALVDAILVYIYMKYVHQWKDILSSEDVLNPELESQMEGSNEPTIEISTDQPNEPSVDQPNDPPIEPPQSDPIIETSATIVEQNIEPSNAIPEETQIQVIEDSPGMYELFYNFLKLYSY